MPSILTSRQRKQIIEWFRQGFDYTDIEPLLIKRGWPVLDRRVLHYYKKAYCPELIGTNTLRSISKSSSSLGFQKSIKCGEDACIYLFWMEGDFYKIGIAANPIKRLKAFAFLPYEVKLIHHLPVKAATTFEAKLHRKFAQKRVRGEWFLLSEEDVQFVKGLTKDSSF